MKRRVHNASKTQAKYRRGGKMKAKYRKSLSKKVAQNIETSLANSGKAYGVHAAEVRSASGKETRSRVQTRVLQKKKSIANESKTSVHSADNRPYAL